MATAQELVEQGIRAYVEGRLADARLLLEEALQVDAGNSRARSYLLLLPVQAAPSSPTGPSRTMAATGGPGPRSTPVPFPAASATPLPSPWPRPTPVPVAEAHAPPAPEPIPEPDAVPASAPAERPLETPADMALRAPAGPAFDVPVEITGERPLEAPIEPASENPFDLPLETPVDVPVEITGEHPFEAAPQAEYAPSPWDDGPASAPSIILGSEGGLSLDAVAETSISACWSPGQGGPRRRRRTSRSG